VIAGAFMEGAPTNPSNKLSRLKIHAAGIKDIALRTGDETHLFHKTVIGVCTPATPGLPVWAACSFKGLPDVRATGEAYG